MIHKDIKAVILMSNLFHRYISFAYNKQTIQDIDNIDSYNYDKNDYYIVLPNENLSNLWSTMYLHKNEMMFVQYNISNKLYKDNKLLPEYEPLLEDFRKFILEIEEWYSPHVIVVHPNRAKLNF